MRCVYIFKNLEVKDLRKIEAVDQLKGDRNKIIETLQKFNFNWQDSTYRDTFEVEERYSLIQQEYFKTEPRFRKHLLKKWMIFKDQQDLINNYMIKNKYENDKKQYLLDNFFLL